MTTFKAGNFTAPNATGNQSISGLGFTPGAELFVATAGSNNGTIARLLLGMAKSSSERVAGTYWADGLAGTSNTSRGFKSSMAMVAVTSDVQADTFDFTSQDSDGFSINWQANNNGLVVNYLALPQGISRKVSTFDSNATSGNQAITGVGFQPKAIIFFSTLPNTTEGGAADAFFSVGAATSSTNRSAAAYRDRDAQGTTDAACYMASAKAFVQISTAAVIFDFDLVSMDSDGFTINIGTTDGTARRIAYLALGGTGFDAKIGTVTQKNGTGNDATTGAGFNPDALVLFGTSAATLDAINTNPRLAIGFATGASERGYAMCASDNGAATSFCSRRISTTKCIGAVADNNGTLLCEADLVSFDSDGFTLNWTTADATLRKFFYLALKYTAPVGPGVSGKAGWMWCG